MLTSEQQINRLLRPGSTYFNLNPFEVLQAEPELTIEQIKKKYRSLSFLVHPDKNQDNKERAQLAFEAVNKAWKTLENEVTRKRCLDIYEEAKDRTDHMVNIYTSLVKSITILHNVRLIDSSEFRLPKNVKK